MKNQLTLKVLVSCLTLASLVVASWFLLFRKQQKNLCGSKYCIGYYTGLGLLDDNSPLGYRYYRITYSYETGPTFEIIPNGTKWGKMKAYFANRQLAVEGDCEIEGKGSDIFPIVNTSQNCTYFDPFGNKVSQILNGTGECHLFDNDGKLRYYAQVSDGRVVTYKLY